MLFWIKAIAGGVAGYLFPRILVGAGIPLDTWAKEVGAMVNASITSEQALEILSLLCAVIVFVMACNWSTLLAFFQNQFQSYPHKNNDSKRQSNTKDCGLQFGAMPIQGRATLVPWEERDGRQLRCCLLHLRRVGFVDTTYNPSLKLISFRCGGAPVTLNVELVRREGDAEQLRAGSVISFCLYADQRGGGEDKEKIALLAPGTQKETWLPKGEYQLQLEATADNATAYLKTITLEVKETGAIIPMSIQGMNATLRVSGPSLAYRIKQAYTSFASLVWEPFYPRPDYKDWNVNERKLISVWDLSWLFADQEPQSQNVYLSRRARRHFDWFSKAIGERGLEVAQSEDKLRVAQLRSDARQRKRKFEADPNWLIEMSYLKGWLNKDDPKPPFLYSEKRVRRS